MHRILCNVNALNLVKADHSSRALHIWSKEVSIYSTIFIESHRDLLNLNYDSNFEGCSDSVADDDGSC